MAMLVSEIIVWLESLDDDTLIGIDDGGLQLQEATNSENYLEVGGIPDEDEEDDLPDSPQSSAITAKDIREFNGYLRNCTDKQVRGVFEKEKLAARWGYVELAKQELLKRNLWE
jgi:hypothetical protein